MRLTPRTGRFNWWININLTWGRSLSQHIKCSLCLLSSRKQNASFTHSLQGFMKRSFPDVFKGWSHQMPLTQVPWERVSQPHVHGWHHHVSKASRLTVCLKHQGHTHCPTLGCNIMANSLETAAGRVRHRTEMPHQPFRQCAAVARRAPTLLRNTSPSCAGPHSWMNSPSLWGLRLSQWHQLTWGNREMLFSFFLFLKDCRSPRTWPIFCCFPTH